MDPYIGEIRIVGFNYAPQNWALCNGQLLNIAQNTALFAVLGTMYGGNGSTNFALPNLQGRVPVHFGQLAGGGSYVQGQAAGQENVTLLGTQMPSHNHTFSPPAANQAGATANPTNAYIAQVQDPNQDSPIPSFVSGTPTSPAQLAGGLTGVAGGNQAHTNLQPYLTLNFIIALTGIYPPRN